MKIRGVIGLTLALPLAVVGYFVLRANGETDMNLDFDPVLWADETRYFDPPHPRLAMAKAVMKSELSIGQSREAVVARLGPANDTPYFKDLGLVYWLGPEPSGLGVDSSWLVIELDDAGLVKTFSLKTD